MARGAAASDHPGTLLGRIQRELRDDRRPDDQYVLDPMDRSVAVHACHGPARQVEVLREVLLGLLAADSTLEPRDILVMCPDIEAFAPLITAAFGVEDEAGAPRHPGHQLRVRLADRSLRQTNPLLATVARLLELADARVTATEVLDLAASPPVRRRFDFDDDDLERVRDWVTRSGIRWGLDAAHRAPFRLQHVGQNTWQAGLDRILLGAAMSEDDHRWLGLALPLDDVDSGDIDLAGRLAELVHRLGTALDELTGERTLADWVSSLSGALDALTEVSDQDSWQLAQARPELAEVAEEAGVRATEVRLTLADVRSLLAGRLRGRPTRANFRTGSLTMCSLVPMRSVPHRVICLLGLDDGTFPRNAVLDGDDVLARDPLVGERDRRSEERQLLLDAILAAQEHLVILYTGADDRTNVPRLPAVPVGEILDALDATARAADGSLAREQVVVHHPLQPFDPRNFTAGTLGAEGPFSFDRPALAGAMAAARPRRESPPFLPAPLPPRSGQVAVELADLLRFLEHPVRGFLRQRLGVTVLGEDDEVAVGLQAELGYLQSWAVGDRLLTARLAGADPQSCQQAEWRRGTLPPGPLGGRLLDRLLGEVEPLVSGSAAVRTGEPRVLDVAVLLADETQLTGTIPDVYGGTLARVVYSRLGAKHRLRAWGQLLALAASRPTETWQAVTIGRGHRTATRSTLLAPPAEQALQILGDLVDLYRRGLCEPLPLAVKSSHAYASVRCSGGPYEVAVAAAASAWTGSRGMGEADDRYHELVWGPAPDLALLLREPPPATETGPGWPTSEPTRFGVLARRLWDSLLAAETTDAP
ncbi:MAG: exodeoxyribonuclease V subunit gamma [Frankiaceae bacterium]